MGKFVEWETSNLCKHGNTDAKTIMMMMNDDAYLLCSFISAKALSDTVYI